jgi:cold-inducible RNA-binding protein
MTTKLFVASLPFEFTDEKLQELFAASGQVLSAKMVMDRKHGRTRGFGFVTMSSEAEAQAALEKLNGSSIGERKIWVTPARPDKERPEPGSPNGDRAPGSERFSPRRAEGPNSFRHRRPPNRNPNERGRGFDSLFPGAGAGEPSAQSQPRRPFGRSGRGMDFQGKPSYFAGGSSGQPPSGPPRRNGGGWRPKSRPSGGGVYNPEGGSGYGSRGPSNRRGFSGRSQGGRPAGGKPSGGRPQGRFQNRSPRPQRPS